MIVPLLLLVAVLTAALAVLLARLRRLHATSRRADARLAEVLARVAHADSSSRNALTGTTETHASDTDGRSDGSSTRPVRRARRATAIPDRP